MYGVLMMQFSFKKIRIKDKIEMAIDIITGLISQIPVLALIAYIWKIHTDKVSKLDQRVLEIEKNYLDRFEDLKTTLEERLHPISENIAMLVERTKKI